MANSVGSVSVELILAANLNQIGRQLQDLAKAIEGNVGETAARAGKKVEDSLGKNFDNVQKEANSSFDRVGNVISGALSGVEKVAQGAFGVVATGAKVAGAAVAGLAAQALALGVGFNKTQAEVRGALKVIVPDQFEELLKAVNELNDESPFAREVFLDLTKTMAGFGVEAGKIPQVLDGIQQAVAATGGGSDVLQGLGTQFARIASSGRITGDIVQSFASRGIDVFGLLAEEANRAGSAISDFAGKSSVELREEFTKGAADAATQIDALSTALINRFGGATAEVRNTFTGAADRIRASLRNIGGDFTKFFINPLGNAAGGPGAGVDAMNLFADSLSNVRKALQPIAEKLIPPLANAVVNLAKFVNDLSKRLLDLKVITTPITRTFDEFGKVVDQVGKPVEKLTSSGKPLIDMFEKLQGFLPIVAFLVTRFGAAFLGQIPVIGGFLGSLNPVAAGIVALLALMPQVRKAFEDAGKAILPVAQNILPRLSALLLAVQNAIAPLIALVIRGLVAAFTAFAPVIIRVADALTSFLTDAAPGIEAFANRAAQAIEAFATRAAAFVNNVIDTIGRAIEFVRGFFNEIGNVDTGSAFTNILGSVTGLGPVLSGLLPIIQNIAAAIGTLNFGDLFSVAAEGAKSLADQLGILEPLMVGLAVAAGAVAAAVAVYQASLQLAAAKTAIFALAQKLALVAEFALTGGTFTLTGALLGLEAAFGVVISPAVAIVAIVAAVAAAFVILYLKVQPVRDIVDSLVDRFLNLLPTLDQVKAGFQAVVEFLTPVFNILQQILSIAFDVWIGVVAVQITLLIGLFKLIVPVVRALAEALGNILGSVLRALGPLFQAVGNVARSLIPVFQAVGNIIRFFRENVQLLIPLLIPLVPFFVAIGAAIAAVVVVFKLLPPIIQLVGNIISGVLTAAIQILTDALNGLADIINFVVGVFNFFIGVIRVFGDVLSTIANIVGTVISAIAEFGPIRSVIEGVTGVAATLRDIFLGFGPVKAIIEGVRDVFGAIGGAIDGIIGKAKGLTKAFGFLGKLNPFKSAKKDADDAGKAIEDVGNKTQQTGQKIQQTTKQVTEFVNNFKRISDIKSELAAIPAALLTSVQDATKAADPVLQAAEKAKSANEAVQGAQAGLAEATKRVNDLQKERAKILQNTISPAKEIANAEKDLTRARFRLAEIDREVAKTEKELADFRAFGRAETEAALERDLERAKIATNQARREEQALLAEVNKEKDKGNQANQLDINLSGLTLDQARNKLAAVRATLAAQKQGQKTEQDGTGEALTQEQIEEKKRLARLDVLDAEQRQRDAERAHAGFREEADAKEAAFQQSLIELNFQKQEQQDAINAQQQHLNDLRAGETTLAQNLKQIDEQIASAKRSQAEAAGRVRDAVRAARDAQREAAVQAALFTGQQQRAAELMAQQLRDRAGLLNLEPQVRAQLEKSLEPLNAGLAKTRELQGEIAKLGQAAVDQAKGLDALFNQQFSAQEVASGQAAQFVQQNLLADDSLPNQLLEAAHKALAVDPNDVFAKAVRDIIQNLFAQRFSGFEKGGFVPGVGDGFGRVIRVAERGAEAVLPLTRPFDMTRVLQDQRVLHPVLNALGRVTLPRTSGTGSLIQNTSTSIRTINRGSGGTSNFNARIEQRQQNRELAQMIAEELVARGFEGGSVTVEAPITVEGAYNEELVARRVEDRIMKAIERRLR